MPPKNLSLAFTRSRGAVNRKARRSARLGAIGCEQPPEERLHDHQAPSAATK